MAKFGGFALWGARIYILVMLLQMFRSITLDLEMSDARGVDLIGYLICSVVSIVLLVQNTKAGYLRITSLLPVAVLLTYVYINKAFTSSLGLVLNDFVGRSSLLIWTLCGVGLALTLRTLTVEARIRESGGRGHPVHTVLVIVAMLGLAGFYAQQYAGAVVHYQPLAYAAMVMMVVGTLVVEAEYGSNVPLYVDIGLFAACAYLTVSLVALQSASILAFFIVILFVQVWRALTSAKPLSGLAFAACILLGGALFANSELLERLGTETRFVAVWEGGQLRSIESRLEILPSFGLQFGVAPILGHSEAELVSDVGEGQYLHSIVLSFLTHTGVVGTAIFIFVLWRHLVGASQRGWLEGLTTSALWLLAMSVALGSFMTFYTWPILWFLLGLTSLRKRKSEPRFASLAPYAGAYSALK